MKNIEVLGQYKKSDLRRIAKGKISEIVGMNPEKILNDLSKVLGNYESIKNNIEFRKPPVHTILEVIFDSPDHMVKVEELHSLVAKKIRSYKKHSKDIDLNDRNYRLYAKALNAAWEYEGDLLKAEANILRVLREELNISKKEHQFIMAHPQSNRLFFKRDRYDRELTFLSAAGIILIYKTEAQDYFVLTDETVESLKELWAIELEKQQFLRLLKNINNGRLSAALRSVGLPLSGARNQLIARIITNEIMPSYLLDFLSTPQLASYLKKIGLTQGGAKDEKILRLVEFYRLNKDIEKPKEEQPPPIDVEERMLSEDKLKDLLSGFTAEQLGNSLEDLGLLKSGSKNVRIDRLAKSQFNTKSILDTLTLEELRNTSKRVGLQTSRKKPDLIKKLIYYNHQLAVQESKLPAKELLNYYSELSCQETRIYKGNGGSKVSLATVGHDFERATKYLFKNIFNLETKTQKFGKEEPDGMVRDDEGNVYLYECKTVLNPPYTLPISHRLQIRNYIDQIANTRDKERVKGYLIISHSFPRDIDKKIQAIKSSIDELPIGVIKAKDLAALGKKWANEYPTDTLPIGRLVNNGVIRLRGFDKLFQKSPVFIS